MAITVQIVASGVAALERDLTATAKRVGDLRRFWRDVFSPLLSKEFELAQTLQAGPDGAWTPLADATIEDRMRKGYPGAKPILWRTGEGFRSLIDPNHPDAVEKIEKNRYTRGTTREYMAAHERGTSNMPARRWSPSDSFWTEAEEKLADYVVEPMKGKR